MAGQPWQGGCRVDDSRLSSGAPSARAKAKERQRWQKRHGVFLHRDRHHPDEASARADYEVVKDLHAVGAVGTYDAAVVRKDEDGKVHVNKGLRWPPVTVGGVGQRPAR